MWLVWQPGAESGSRAATTCSGGKTRRRRSCRGCPRHRQHWRRICESAHRRNRARPLFRCVGPNLLSPRAQRFAANEPFQPSQRLGQNSPAPGHPSAVVAGPRAQSQSRWQTAHTPHPGNPETDRPSRPDIPSASLRRLFNSGGKARQRATLSAFIAHSSKALASGRASGTPSFLSSTTFHAASAVNTPAGAGSGEDAPSASTAAFAIPPFQAGIEPSGVESSP